MTADRAESHPLRLQDQQRPLADGRGPRAKTAADELRQRRPASSAARRTRSRWRRWRRSASTSQPALLRGPRGRVLRRNRHPRARGASPRHGAHPQLCGRRRILADLRRNLGCRQPRAAPLGLPRGPRRVDAPHHRAFRRAPGNARRRAERGAPAGALGPTEPGLSETGQAIVARSVASGRNIVRVPSGNSSKPYFR